MTTITVTPKLRRQLLDFSKPIEFRDEAGHVLGFLNPVLFTPLSDECVKCRRVMW